MSVPRLDPRMNQDRVYQYGEYVVLSAQFKHRRHLSLIDRLARRRILRRRLAAPIRLLGFKVGIISGLFVLLASVSALGFYSADTARLAYAKQESSAALAGLDQAMTEAVQDNMQREAAVLAGGKVSAAEAVRPARVKFVTLTNIPDPTGVDLIEQLYPLSREVIEIAR